MLLNSVFSLTNLCFQFSHAYQGILQCGDYAIAECGSMENLCSRWPDCIQLNTIFYTIRLYQSPELQCLQQLNIDQL